MYYNKSISRKINDVKNHMMMTSVNEKREKEKKVRNVTLSNVTAFF